ncbi:MAG: hypothetical protein NXI22_06700 [bacterium]|nr:hypothetical protein [bacterium]
MIIWNFPLFLLTIVLVGDASSQLHAEKPTSSLEDVAFSKTVYTFKSRGVKKKTTDTKTPKIARASRIALSKTQPRSLAVKARIIRTIVITRTSTEPEPGGMLRHGLLDVAFK